MSGEDGGVREILHAVIQGFGEGFDKGAASGGAGFVEQHAVNGLILDLNAFHILAADIQDAVYRRIEKGGGIVMGYGFHFAVVQKEGGFHQSFPITGGAGTDDVYIFWQQLIDFFQRTDGCFQRAAVVIGIEGIQQGAVFPHQCNFRGSGAGINAQKYVSLIRGKLRRFHMIAAVAFLENFICSLAVKQGLHTLHFKFHLDLGRKPAEHFRHGAGYVLFRVEGGADRSEQMGIARVDYMLAIQLQGSDKSGFQLRKKVQRSAQEGHVSPDGLSAGQSRDGLIDHCLEDGSSQILFCSAFVDQGLDIRLCKHTASGGDCV